LSGTCDARDLDPNVAEVENPIHLKVWEVFAYRKLVCGRRYKAASLVASWADVTELILGVLHEAGSHVAAITKCVQSKLSALNAEKILKRNSPSFALRTNVLGERAQLL
jgi:hypothetical protein